MSDKEERKMKIINVAIVIFLFLTTSGCSTFQSSNYTNYNTPYGNVVKASGRAADNAALANTSYNCPSCAINGQSGGNSRGGKSSNYNRQATYLHTITESAIRTLSNEVTSSINDAIRDSF